MRHGAADKIGKLTTIILTGEELGDVYDAEMAVCGSAPCRDM